MPDTSQMMKPEPDLYHLEELLKETLDVAKENNKLLKRIRRDAIIGGILKALLWIVLIIGSFYLSVKMLQPYLDMLNTTNSGGTDWQALFNQYKSQLGQ
jgi:hypothetical protein